MTREGSRAWRGLKALARARHTTFCWLLVAFLGLGGCSDEDSPSQLIAPDSSAADAEAMDASSGSDASAPDGSDDAAVDDAAVDDAAVDATGPGACGVTLACGASEFCDYTGEFMCGGAGACRPRPDVCAGIFEPVCGCNGRDYSNVCAANADGTDAASMGMCP